jgi:hypothetical protein
MDASLDPLALSRSLGQTLSLRQTLTHAQVGIEITAIAAFALPVPSRAHASSWTRWAWRWWPA